MYTVNLWHSHLICDGSNHQKGSNYCRWSNNKLTAWWANSSKCLSEKLGINEEYEYTISEHLTINMGNDRLSQNLWKTGDCIRWMESWAAGNFCPLLRKKKKKKDYATSFNIFTSLTSAFSIALQHKASEALHTAQRHLNPTNGERKMKISYPFMTL